MDLQKTFVCSLRDPNGRHYYYPHFTDEDNKVQSSKFKVLAPRSHLKSRKAIFWVQTPIFYAFFSKQL